MPVFGPDTASTFAARRTPYADAASARFVRRAAARTAASIPAARRPMEVALADPDTADRVQSRLALLNPRDGIGLERVIGESDLVEINYLDLGIVAARAVARVQVRDLTGRGLGYGTGFMVSPTLLMTNHHVLPSVDEARRSLAEFNYQDDAAFLPLSSVPFTLDVDRFFLTDEALDFTLVAVAATAAGGRSLQEFGFLRLLGDTGKALVGEYVTVIQHPDGAPKQIALRENEVVDIFDDFVHYKTDTKPGSSGSPVFTDQWQVVALHHSGVEAKNSQGQTLAKDGHVWQPAMGEDAIAWVANEGIRISSIFTALRAATGLSGTQEALLQELLDAAAPRPAGTRSPTPGLAAGGALVVEERTRTSYEGRTGYDREFLGTTVSLPALPTGLEDDVSRPEGAESPVLDYTHYSLVLRKSRRLPFFTAVNIDRHETVKYEREGRDVWYYDGRIPQDDQMGPKVYEKNDLDQGHLVRRLDPVWGPETLFPQANDDTFHFTNCSPQHKALNRTTWLELEDFILGNAETHGLKVTVFTGPVFRDDDLVYKDVYRIPAEFWKVVVIVKEDDNTLSATAYLQTQKNLVETLEFAYADEYNTYQVPVARIEALTGLDFGALREADPLFGMEGTGARVITTPQSIRL